MTVRPTCNVCAAWSHLACGGSHARLRYLFLKVYDMPSESNEYICTEVLCVLS